MGSALHRNITEKGKPFLKKYGIPYDLSNYQNDGYLKAGDKGYNFWYDHDNDDFETDAPSYKGKGFADLKELLAYALDVADAKEEYRKAWGDDVFKKRSKSNFDDEEVEDEIDPNDKDVENFDENFERVTKDVDKTGMSNEELGKLYEEKKIADEMADFQKSLDDYAAKNKKGREDIPATYKR